jgi:4-hydroxyphenylpyruvate dioxygenase
MEDFLPLNGTDHVEFIVGNAKQVAHFYKTAFGFQDLAYCGLETGVQDRTSYVLRQDKITLVITAPMTPESPLHDHLRLHGDESAFEPYEISDEHGTAVLSGIKTYGDTVHVFVERNNYRGAFLPGYKPLNREHQPAPVGLKFIDHMVGNVNWGEMNKWADFYARVMGFTQLISFDDKDISTDYTALMSKVMSNGNGRVKFPINEPAEGKKKSQIEEYINFYRGSGVQHIAVATDNILETVTALKERGVEFLYVPNTYYKDILERVGPIEEDLEPLQRLGILIDRDEDGYLLQLFTKPVMDRPTVFFEIIQRRGAKSFGKGNFKALFEAIEHEQSLRGTL